MDSTILAGLAGPPTELNVPFVAVAARAGRTLLYGVTAPPAGALELIVWDVADDGTRRQVRRLAIGHDDVASIDLSPDGAVLAIGRQRGPDRLSVELWAAGDP